MLVKTPLESFVLCGNPISEYGYSRRTSGGSGMCFFFTPGPFLVRLILFLTCQATTTYHGKMKLLRMFTGMLS